MPVDMKLYMQSRRKSRRSELIELAGGVCVKCGSADSLEFDHLDKSTKLFELSGCHLDKAWSKIMAEYDKCQLLCSSCHRKKTLRVGDHNGGHNIIKACGTEAMYAKGCRCGSCRKARYDARVARGELKGTHPRNYDPS